MAIERHFNYKFQMILSNEENVRSTQVETS